MDCELGCFMCMSYREGSLSTKGHKLTWLSPSRATKEACASEELERRIGHQDVRSESAGQVDGRNCVIEAEQVACL